MKIGVAYWGGIAYPSEVEMTCMGYNSLLFDKTYFILDVPEIIPFNSNTFVLDSNPLYNWIDEKFGDHSIEKLTPNYIADILTYNAFEILTEAYGVEISDHSNVCKFDTDVLIYNPVLLDYLCNNMYHELLLLNDQSLRVWGPPSYRNCGVSFNGGTGDRWKSFVNDKIKKYIDHGFETYTDIGPKLANSMEINGSIHSAFPQFLANLTNITVNPGILTDGTIKIPLDKCKLAVHLTISDCHKYGWDLKHIELIDGNVNLTVNRKL